MPKLQKLTEEKMDQCVRRAIIRLFYAVVLPSPVDTGRFRANWNVAYGAPNLTTNEVTRSRGEKKRGLQVGNTRTSASNRERQQIESVKLMKMDGKVYLTNNLVYAITLEYGHSAQAPHGMVRTAIAMWPAIVRRSVKG